MRSACKCCVKASAQQSETSAGVASQTSTSLMFKRTCVEWLKHGSRAAIHWWARADSFFPSQFSCTTYVSLQHDNASAEKCSSTAGDETHTCTTSWKQGAVELVDYVCTCINFATKSYSYVVTNTQQ